MNTLAKLNRLAKWRSVFAGWQLGTRTKDDPESQAVRDHREVTILLRAEASALTRLLIDKGIFTIEEWNEQLGEEADALSKAYEEKFPGMEATDHGISMDVAKAQETMRGWRP
jgi:hypothetical protein